MAKEYEIYRITRREKGEEPYTYLTFDESVAYLDKTEEKVPAGDVTIDELCDLFDSDAENWNYHDWVDRSGVVALIIQEIVGPEKTLEIFKEIAKRGGFIRL